MLCFVKTGARKRAGAVCALLISFSVLFTCKGIGAVSPRPETLILVGAFEHRSGLPPRRLRAMRVALSACLAEIPGFAVISPYERVHAMRMLGRDRHIYLDTPFSREREVAAGRRLARLLGVHAVLGARISTREGILTIVPHLEGADGSRYRLPQIRRPAGDINGILNALCRGLPERMDFLRKPLDRWRNRKAAEALRYGAGFAYLENGLTNEILENVGPALKVYNLARKNGVSSPVLESRIFALQVRKAGRAEAAKLIQAAVQEGKLSRAALAHVLLHLGRSALEEEDWKAARDRYERVLKLYGDKSAPPGAYHPAAARIGLARALTGLRRIEDAFGQLTAARKLLNKHGYQNSLLYIESSIALGYIKFREDNLPEAYYAFQGAMERLRVRDGGDSVIFAIASYNTAVVLAREGRPRRAAPLLEGALHILENAGLRNTRLFLALLIQRGNVQYIKNEQVEALGDYRHVMLTGRMLDLFITREHAAALYNQAVIYKRNNDLRRSRRLFAAAAELYRRLRAGEDLRAARAGRMRMRSPSPYLAAGAPYRNSVGLTRAGEKLIRSYTGRYNLARHSPAIRARTYAGRQDDTNVFIRDLLNHALEDKRGLVELRRAFLAPGSKHRDGRGLLFVDIGPAVANLKQPAVTSVKIARDFSEMQVVALDLPAEIKRWRENVSRKAKRTLLRYANIRILSGDGLESLKDQFARESNWVLTRRGPALYDGSTPIIVRAANSIDIYVPYRFVKPSIRRMGLDFRENPVIYFFNRSILFKPRGDTRFQVVGFVSIRGFHHNRTSFSRGGDQAYTLVHKPGVTLKRQARVDY